MKYTTKTEYGLLCMIHMAKRPEGGRVTIKALAAKENYPLPYMEKIFQELRQAKLVLAHHGNQGGYTLAKKPSEISLKEIINALEGGTFDAFCAPQVREDIVCTHFCLCGVKPVWRKTKQLLDQFYHSVTLEMLMKNEIEVQHLLPAVA